ncbi:sigma-54-dependent transcriptional regulator [Haloferula rosea]|uniref:Sigma-54-dependent Fis family transcriptional regulator n=1 Tax=Haloferula rosea TaxID=490093 RepID=A0A934RDT4_9BACT|nr:sigma-54 dependent transcriptional regulator [Haloferula rosea]MBK1827246.1 sigma-54-dependent Fis family transcriptional regulator [Haloferula rosea]
MLPTLLIVDDEIATRDGLRAALEEEFDVTTASNLEEARAILKADAPELLLTDLRLGGDSGMEVLDEALSIAEPPVSIMMTAYGSVDTAVEAMRRGAWNFVTKPLNLDGVELLLKRALRSRRLETENKQLREQAPDPAGLGRLTGKSPRILKVIDTVKQVAPTRATVLIEGESGTGKEVVAHAIHQLSGRPQDKMVIVHCAALSPQLLESELFGHEKGAFTGASQRRIGRFEQADGGTLFLDEIGEIDATTQVKLLRALSERTIERVGSNTTVKVDVRVLAATNRDLAAMVEAGDFREDLYFRLNVVRVVMPPLRERAEDVVLLAGGFLREFAEENGRPIKPLSDAAMACLRKHSWPGNVRELRTAIEHGVVMSNEPVIDVKHLPAGVRGEAAVPTPERAGKIDLAAPPEFNLHALEIRTIRAALDQSGGNRTHAAELLGISRRTLQRKLKEIDG